MPELPEVTTTVKGLNRVLKGLAISDVWTDWQKMIYHRPFSAFRKKITGRKFLKAERRGKNILIHLSGGLTVLIHMKMTGHIMYGHYHKHQNKWLPHPQQKNKNLKDPYNRFIHFVFILDNGKHLVFSDTRKFGKIALIETEHLPHSPHLAHLGPEPLAKSFDLKTFGERLWRRAKTKIKTVLMDQTVIAGIGNIYSDEILWQAGVHPERKVNSLSARELGVIFKALKPTLKRGIKLGGDSMSDYRNIRGRRGKFQNTHRAYRKTGEPCSKPNCRGVIARKIVNGRSAHFCPRHQVQFGKSGIISLTF